MCEEAKERKKLKCSHPTHLLFCQSEYAIQQQPNSLCTKSSVPTTPYRRRRHRYFDSFCCCFFAFMRPQLQVKSERIQEQTNGKRYFWLVCGAAQIMHFGNNFILHNNNSALAKWIEWALASQEFLWRDRVCVCARARMNEFVFYDSRSKLWQIQINISCFVKQKKKEKTKTIQSTIDGWRYCAFQCDKQQITISKNMLYIQLVLIADSIVERNFWIIFFYCSASLNDKSPRDKNQFVILCSL